MDATDKQRGAEAGEGRGGRGGGGGEGGEETDIKSNNPHLTGGELRSAREGMLQLGYYIPYLDCMGMQEHVCFSGISVFVW